MGKLKYCTSEQNELFLSDSKAMYLDFSQVPDDLDEFQKIHGTPIDAILQQHKVNQYSTICIPPPPFMERTVDYVFPEKVWYLLSSKNVSEDIISWMPHGRAFKIKDIEAMEREVIPKYFRHNKYASFKRQLNLWNFQRVAKGLDVGCYFHPFFLRSKLNLVKRMRRQKIKGDINKGAKQNNHLKKKSLRRTSAVPFDFYALSLLRPLPMDKDYVTALASFVPHLLVSSKRNHSRQLSADSSAELNRPRLSFGKDSLPTRGKSTSSLIDDESQIQDEPAEMRCMINPIDFDPIPVDLRYEGRHNLRGNQYFNAGTNKISRDRHFHTLTFSHPCLKRHSLRNIFNEDEASGLNPSFFQQTQKEELCSDYLYNFSPTNWRNNNNSRLGMLS